MSETQVTVPPILEKILLEFTVNVLVDKPEDIISYAADYFTRLKDKRNSDNLEGGIEDETDIYNRLGARGARRQSVVGEKYDPEAEEDDEEIKTFPKTDEEWKRIKEKIEEIFIFRDLDEEDKKEIVDVMIPRKVDAGRVIISQGDDGDFFYVIDNGIFEAFVKNAKGEEIKVMTYDNSGSFGELALLHNQPRAATVKAVTDGALWAVSRKVFNRLVVRRAYDKRQKYMSLLEKVPELQPLTEFEKMQVCDALKPVALKKGRILFEEGDEGEGMYFVEDGEISITQKTAKGEEEVAHLEPGDYFGGMSTAIYR